MAVIKDASYYFLGSWPKNDDPVNHVPVGLAQETTCAFYTAAGNLIKQIDYGYHPSYDHLQPSAMLDPSAPKPKVASYRRVWWPAINIGIGTKGTPGYAVLFHDVHGNRFAWERVASEDAVLCAETFNMSDAVEEASDFSLKRQQRNSCTIL
jgi:hypothetical protein